MVKRLHTKLLNKSNTFGVILKDFKFLIYNFPFSCYCKDFFHLSSSFTAPPSIIASLINLIISINKDWNRLLNNNNNDTTTTNKFSDNTTLLGMGGGNNVLELDTPVVRMACNLKCLRDQAAILCAVHEAVGLEDLKKISEAFRPVSYTHLTLPTKA